LQIFHYIFPFAVTRRASGDKSLRRLPGQQPAKDCRVDALAFSRIELNFGYGNSAQKIDRPFRQLFPRTVQLSFGQRWQLIDAIAARVIVEIVIEWTAKEV
jgi:hypothetical protein